MAYSSDATPLLTSMHTLTPIGQDALTTGAQLEVTASS